MNTPAEQAERPPRYLTIEEVAERVRVTAMTIRRWVERKEFPAPRRHGPRLVMWNVEDVETWEKNRQDSWR